MDLIRVAVTRLCRNRIDARAVLRATRARNAKAGDAFESPRSRLVERHWRPALAWVLLDMRARQPDALVLGIVVYGGLVATTCVRLLHRLLGVLG